MKLIGYCSEGKNRLLVYEFMQKGSLENHLFRSKFYIHSQHSYLNNKLLSLTTFCFSSKLRHDFFSYFIKLCFFFFIYAEGVQPISWITRINIAIGVARGLAFLHSLDANVIYRDLKASNILLDSVCYIEKLGFCFTYKSMHS